MWPSFRIHIEFPALDRLLAWMESHDKAQTSIDALTKRIQDINATEKAALKLDVKENQ